MCINNYFHMIYILGFAGYLRDSLFQTFILSQLKTAIFNGRKLKCGCNFEIGGIYTFANVAILSI